MDGLHSTGTEGMFPIRLSGIRFSPGGRNVLAGIDLDIGDEGVTAVIGPNGAGKTVLLRVLAGLQAVDDGEVRWNGDAFPPDGIAMVFQSPVMLRSSVFHNASLSLIPAGLSRAEVHRRTLEVLERVGLAHRAEDSARLLSGGEQQHFGIADQHRGQRHSLLLAAREAMRRAVPEAGEREAFQCRVDPPQDFVLLPAKLQRAERQFVEDGRVEKLHVGILENQADASAKGEMNRVLGQCVLAERFAKRLHLAGTGKAQRVEQAQQRRFSRAVGAEQGNALAPADTQRNAVQRRHVLIGIRNVVQFEHAVVHWRLQTISTGSARATPRATQSRGRVRKSSSRRTSPR